MLLLFILKASWLCDVETEKALHQNAELAWLVAVPRVPWGGMQDQTHCPPIHKNEDKESR